LIVGSLLFSRLYLSQAICLGLLIGGGYFLIAFNSLEKVAVFPRPSP